MRLVNAGHDYSMIVRFWNLPMVMKANIAMDVQAEVDAKAQRKAQG
jgi:hypothetical protein